MFSLPVIKAVAQIVGGLGVSRVALQIVRNNTAVLSMTDVILIRVGGIVIGSMAVQSATNHIGETIDDIVENVKERLTKDEKVVDEEEVDEDETADGA